MLQWIALKKLINSQEYLKSLIELKLCEESNFNFLNDYCISSGKRPGAYSVLKLLGVVLIGRWHLKEENTYFKVREIIHMKFPKFEIFAFLIAL